MPTCVRVRSGLLSDAGGLCECLADGEVPWWLPVGPLVVSKPFEHLDAVVDHLHATIGGDPSRYSRSRVAGLDPSWLTESR